MFPIIVFYLTQNVLFIFTEEQLITVCLDFFIAGAQTSSSTLLFAFLNMIIHQDVQKRAYQEIIAVLGDRKYPSLADRSR